MDEVKRKFENMGYPVDMTIEAAIVKATNDHQEVCAKEKTYLEISVKKRRNLEAALKPELEHLRGQVLPANKEMTRQIESA